MATKKALDRFSALVELIPPQPRKLAEMTSACQNWAVLHPKLRDLEPSQASLNICRQFMYIEMNREGGPRAHMMDRMYKRFSNLRRRMESEAMAAVVPDWPAAPAGQGEDEALTAA